MTLVSAPDVVDKYEHDFNHCTIRYGDMKKQLAADMIKLIAPIREKAEAIRQDEKYLAEVIQLGREKAHKSAAVTIDLVREAMGMKYF